MTFEKLDDTSIKNAIVIFASRVMDAIIYGSEQALRENVKAINDCLAEIEKRQIEKGKI